MLVYRTFSAPKNFVYPYSRFGQCPPSVWGAQGRGNEHGAFTRWVWHLCIVLQTYLFGFYCRFSVKEIESERGQSGNSEAPSCD